MTSQRARRRTLRILIPSIVDPVLHRGGAGAATRGLLRLLGSPPVAAETVVIAPESPLSHRARQALALARSVVSPLPSKALFLATRSFRRRVASALERVRPDLVLLNGSDLLSLVPLLPVRVPVVLYSHNLEHELYRSQIERLPRAAAPLRPLLRRDLAKLARFEHDGMARVGHVLFISADDEAAAMAAHPATVPAPERLAVRSAPRSPTRAAGPFLRTLHLPPLFDYPPLPRSGAPPAEPPQLVMLANFTWWPNRDGLVWLRDRVLPGVRRDLRIHLLGRGSERLAGREPRLRAHGWVPDLVEVLGRCGAMLCPVVSGAGVNVKLAESLYNGIPVLATPFAARGLALGRLAGGRAGGEPPAGLALVEGADAWTRFLDGSGLDALCRARVPPALADAFSPGAHAEAVGAFLEDALGVWRDPAAPQGSAASSPAVG